MTKQEQFLWMVQTAILANAIKLSMDDQTALIYRDTYSSSGVRIVMSEAIRASSLIPDDMDAADAADDFCIWMFRNHQDELKKADPSATVPYWFAQ